MGGEEVGVHVTIAHNSMVPLLGSDLPLISSECYRSI